FGRQYVEDLAGFCQRSIEDFYLQIGTMQERRNPRYFAEKYIPTQLPRIMWELYPKAREVFLVRDFRVQRAPRACWLRSPAGSRRRGLCAAVPIGCPASPGQLEGALRPGASR